MTRRDVRKRKSAGYTLIEVMMAMAVLTVGALGIFALQDASMQGNLEARDLSTATGIGRTWIERLRVDSLRWPQPVPGTVPSLAATNYLARVVSPATLPVVWTTPVPAAYPAESYAFDHFGRDVAINTASTKFCVDTRMQWIYQDQAMRADVRVWWRRRTSDTAANVPTCGTNPSNVLRTNRGLRFVYLSTVLRWQPRSL